MTRVRKVRPEEVPVLREKFSAKWPWAAEPQWNGVFVLERDGIVRGFVGFQVRLLVEPLYAEDALTARDLIVWTDGRMGDNDYEFFVADENEPFGKAVEKHFGIEGHREVPGLTYQVKREVCH